MRKHTKILALTVVLAAAGWFAGCNSTIDSEPNVVLEVATITIPPVTATTSAGICSFTIPTASATLNNKPKNHLAAVSPFNDIIMREVVVDYAWDDGASALVGQRFGVGGTVPAGGSSSATFSVVDNTVLSTNLTSPNVPGTPSVDGHSARLTLTFHGTTVNGDAASVTTGGTLLINSCAAPTRGACCTGGGGCQDNLSQVDCTSIGGAYAGDNTSCLTATCPS